MAIFSYAPGVQVAIHTMRAGVVDVSDDLIRGAMVLNENAPHSFRFSIKNHRRQYDGIFTPNDRIFVRMKRINWLPIMSGYLNRVPLFSAYPRDVQLSATCTIKKLQYRLWDPGTQAAADLLRDVGEAQNDSDGGAKERLIRLLTEVAGWPKDLVHIGEVPARWFDNIADLYATLSGRIEATRLSVGALASFGGVSPQSGAPTTIEGIGPGTGALPYTSGKVSWFGGPNGGAYGAMQLTGESGSNPTDPWYCAMRFPYYDPNTIRRIYPPEQTQAAIAWWRNRKILVTNPKNNRSVVLRAADWGPHIRTTKNLDMSQHALHNVLGGATNDVMQFAFAPINAPLGAFAGTPPPGAGTRTGVAEGGPMVFPVDGGTYNNKPYPAGDWHAPRSGGRQHQGTDIFAPTGTPNRAVESGRIVPSDGGLGGIGLWLMGDSGAAYFYTHLARRAPGIDGKHVAKGEIIGYVDQTGNAKTTPPHTHFQYHPNGRGAPAAQPAIILDPIRGGTPPDVGAGAPGGDQGLLRGYAWNPGLGDPESNVLSGNRALINDESILPTVQTLIHTSMRSYCSAPNGDFIGWFPDYFGVYGTAGKVIIRDIELKDFTLDWDDASLVTHMFTAGASTGYSVGGQLQAEVTSLRRLWTTGIASVEFREMMTALFNVTPGNDPYNFLSSEAFLQRFGARQKYVPMGTISGEQAEFWYAVFLFQQSWAEQFTANIPLTFMPEIFPGMLVQIPSVMGSPTRFQAYVQSVTHTFDFQDGAGFDTNIDTAAFSVTDGSGLHGLPRGG